MGKTYVTGLILKKLHQSGETAAYYKAAMSGNDRGPDGTLYPGDALRVKELSGIPQPVEEMCPYVYEQAVSSISSNMKVLPVNRQNTESSKTDINQVSLLSILFAIISIRLSTHSPLWICGRVKSSARTTQ